MGLAAYLLKREPLLPLADLAGLTLGTLLPGRTNDGCAKRLNAIPQAIRTKPLARTLAGCPGHDPPVFLRSSGHSQPPSKSSRQPGAGPFFRRTVWLQTAPFLPEPRRKPSATTATAEEPAPASFCRQQEH